MVDPPLIPHQGPQGAALDHHHLGLLLLGQGLGHSLRRVRTPQQRRRLVPIDHQGKTLGGGARGTERFRVLDVLRVVDDLSGVHRGLRLQHAELQDLIGLHQKHRRRR